MAEALPAGPAPSLLDQKLTKTSPAARYGIWVFVVALLIGLIYAGSRLISDLSAVHIRTVGPFVLLGVALCIALGFEFVNGFHDTANAVATVIYTHALEPHLAVVWSGTWNFIGVLLSAGTVAFGIISLLPVELILQVNGSAGYSMVFALLVAAIFWNLGTWFFGLPASSSHTLIGSIIGVGVANQLMSPKTGTSGVDWAQAANVGKTLLISPLVGFACAAILLLLAKLFIKNKALYTAPEGNQPPPFWIRCLLILTCTGVSFAHGSNDGQKGMGLIMLILIGSVPTAYALNHALPARDTQNFIAVSHETSAMLSHYVETSAIVGDPRDDIQDYVRTKEFKPNTMLALRQLVNDIGNEMVLYKSLANVPEDRVPNFRNSLYLISESLRLMIKSGKPKFAADEQQTLTNYQKYVNQSTRFIPLWVKVATAMALGLGTMVGWKRIVVTVGEKIGKSHLSYGQGAVAELVTMGTILGADNLGMPVSTTHVLSSGVAGTMAANGSGLQWGTVRNMLMAWVLTLPASILIAGFLFWLFRTIWP